MENYEQKLMELAKEQIYANFYDVHISSPFYAENSLASRGKGENFTIRLPAETRNDLAEISEQEGISISQLIINAVEYAITKHRDQEDVRQLYLEYILKSKTEPPQITPLRKNGLQRTNISDKRIGDVLRALREGDSE